MTDKRIDLGEAIKMGCVAVSASVTASKVAIAGAIYVIERRRKIEIKNKVKFILYLSTNYPKRNYSRVCKKK